MAAQAMTATQFIEDIANRLDGEYSKADVRKVLVAVAEELQGALADGYKVSIAGVGRFEPRAKAGRKKGDLIRNPFDPDASPKQVTADEPTKVVVKAFPRRRAEKGGEPEDESGQGRRDRVARQEARTRAPARAARRKTRWGPGDGPPSCFTDDEFRPAGRSFLVIPRPKEPRRWPARSRARSCSPWAATSRSETSRTSAPHFTHRSTAKTSRSRSATSPRSFTPTPSRSMRSRDCSSRVGGTAAACASVTRLRSCSS